MSDWRDVTIGSVCDVIAGQSPKGENYNDQGDGLPFYQGKKAFGDKYLGPPEQWTTQVTREAIAGDVLMSVRAPVGPINFATNTICIGRGLAAIRARSDLDRDFLYYALLDMQDEIVGTEGAVYASINKTQIERLTIPLPPLAEQKRIVAILDEAFAAIDAATANARKNLDNARELFESHLNAVIESLPRDWRRERLDAVTTKIGSGATPNGGAKSYQNAGVALVRSLNVYDRDFRNENLAYLSDDQADKLSNVVMEPHDVLFNITGASIARCCTASTVPFPARVNQHVMIVRPDLGELLPDFLCYSLTARCNKDRLLGIGDDGGSTRQAITKAQIQGFEVAFPTVERQAQLVARLNIVERHSDQLARRYTRKLALLAELKQSILHRAFTGELTADEPVPTLLFSDAMPAPKERKTTDEFVEAVLIALFVRHMTDEKFALGRKRYNKLCYLAHRKNEDDVFEHYLKMPAGPYSPWARYGGPERIALGNGYIQSVRRGDFSGFVPGPGIAKVDQYWENYPVCRAVEWVVKRFRYSTTDELELLTTVDYAAIELGQNGLGVNRDNVKTVLASHPDWIKKLKRSLFSDLSIERSIIQLADLFPATVGSIVRTA